jgi:hypothetical protein
MSPATFCQPSWAAKKRRDSADSQVQGKYNTCKDRTLHFNIVERTCLRRCSSLVSHTSSATIGETADQLTMPSPETAMTVKSRINHDCDGHCTSRPDKNNVGHSSSIFIDDRAGPYDDDHGDHGPPTSRLHHDDVRGVPRPKLAAIRMINLSQEVFPDRQGLLSTGNTSIVFF